MPRTSEPSAFATKVLAVVDTIPAGRVLTYGDVAELVGVRSARLVGQALARYGGEVPWHRVVLASGAPAHALGPEQLSRLADEGVPLLADGSRVDLRAARWDADAPAGESG